MNSPPAERARISVFAGYTGNSIRTWEKRKKSQENEGNERGAVLRAVIFKEMVTCPLGSKEIKADVSATTEDG